MGTIKFNYGEVVTIQACPVANKFGLAGFVGIVCGFSNHPDDDDDPYDPFIPIRYAIQFYEYRYVVSFEDHELISNELFDFEFIKMTDDHIGITPEGKLQTPPDE